MASLATCPQCAKQLAVPKGASSDDYAQCPECDATFLLSNTFLTTLPIARILEPVEPPQVSEVPETGLLKKVSLETASVGTTDSSSDIPVSDIPTAATDASDLDDGTPTDEDRSVESLASWESRLKNAIERDAAELTDQDDTAEIPAAEQPLSPSPDFDFHLDPTPAEESVDTEKEPMAESEPVAAELAVTAEESELTTRLNTLPSKRSRKFSPLKLAAVLIGPGIVGIAVGLYALLWIKGPSGDLLNLAQYLPNAMLPAMASFPESEALIEATPLVNSQDLVAEKSPPVEEPLDTHRDETVQTVAAEQAVPPVLNALPDIFGELLAAARSSIPELVEGDLSTDDSVSRKGRAYMAICQLAQQFEATRLPGLDARSQAEAASAKELFDAAAANTSALGDLASIVSRWWGYEKRPNEGIFFAGQIRDTQPLGGRTLCYVMLDEPATATIIPVLLDQTSGHGGDRIVVVGNIVREPRSSLQDFTIDVPQVVVAPYSRVLQP